MPGHAARHARAHDRDFGLQQDFSITGWRVGYADGRCALDAGHGALPRPDLRVRACALCRWAPPRAWSSCRRASTRKWQPIISPSAERLLSALEDAGMKPTVPPGAYYIMASAERLARQNRRGKSAPPAARQPAWPPSPDRHSSAPAAARTCCASASPSRMRSWTRPASGCGSSEGARLVCFDPSASWTYIPGCAAIQDFKFGSCNLRNSTHSSMCSRECFSATSAESTLCEAKKFSTSS